MSSWFRTAPPVRHPGILIPTNLNSVLVPPADVDTHRTGHTAQHPWEEVPQTFHPVLSFRPDHPFSFSWKGMTGRVAASVDGEFAFPPFAFHNRNIPSFESRPGMRLMADPPRNPPIHNPPIRLAVCVSGSGTTLQNLIDRIRAGFLRASIVQVVASRPRIGAIARADAARIPLALAAQGAKSRAEFSASVFDPIRHSSADLVVLGGFLSLVEIPPDYQGRVINIHPSLIPAFCGKGFYGQAVHRAAIEAGVKVSGCTVHFADSHFDTGPIILQRTVPVLDQDTPETLAARVFQEECRALPEAIELYAAGRLKIDGRRVRVLER
jgi:phosphoribosylglycinamide formyltransferase-1